VNNVGNGIRYPGCNPWDVDAHVEGKPCVFMPYTGAVCADQAKSGSAE